MRATDALAVLLVASSAAAIVWGIVQLTRWVRAARLVRRRVVCPVDGEAATVDFLVDAGDGEVYRDVVDCSLVPPGEPIECGKACRSMSVAPFSAPCGSPRRAA